MEIYEINQALMDDATDVLLDSVGAIEQEIWEMIRDLLLSFSTKGGKFDPDEVDIKTINEIKKRVREIIGRSALPNKIDAFLNRFDEIGENVASIHKELSDVKVPKRILTQQKQFAVEQTIFSMMEANVPLKYVDPIKRAIYNHITFGSGVLQAETEIRMMILGSAKKDGILQRWVGQVARDAIQQYEGGINQKVAVEFDMKYLTYVGSLVKDSRPQCKRWVEKGGVIAVEDLPKEIEWAYTNGTGMIPGTDASNFMVLRGGYNCRHTAYPRLTKD